MSTYEYEVPLPGMYIQEELDARGWSQRDLAFILGIEEPALNKIIKGKTGVSFEMSKALAKAFDIDADFFANLQKSYDFARAREPDPSVERRAALQNVYPVREMIKREWIGSDNLEIQLARFFKVKTTNEIPYVIPYVPHAAKKTDSGSDISPLQYAWFSRVLQIADNMPSMTYSESALRQALPRLRALMSEPEETRHVPRILMECGVKYVIVEGLPGGKIDGVCTWNEGRPIIGMSLRFDRIDNFWFVLRHEIEHVLRAHGQNGPIIDAEVMENANDDLISVQEKFASEAAAEFCVQRKELESFIARKEPFFSERDVVGFARRMHVHPGIVVGHIQARTKKWDFLRKYLVRIRHFLLPGAMVDGWGQAAPVSL
jgi:HTH-type transcriptional regulator / antitoxin HigA